MGGGTQGRPSRVNYPAECYLPIHTVKYDGERVIDFSNPLTVKLERERIDQVGDRPGEEHRPGGDGFRGLVGRVAGTVRPFHERARNLSRGRVCRGARPSTRRRRAW